MTLEDKLAEIYRPMAPIMEWGFWALEMVSLLILVTFPIACLISLTLILGSRAGWWDVPDAQAEETNE